jgi:hypothetical protein
MKTFSITTRQIFENAVDSCMDIAWENRNWNGQRELLDAVVSAEIDQLREMFKCGYTPMMVGGALFTAIESADDGEEIEIRIYKEENEKRVLIGVIIESEIKY